ncbi:MAG: hypothetical protein HQK49_13570 [Oligoflexia bacterium]|nr:hypothetical protein [Oligoflexia bacterium]
MNLLLGFLMKNIKFIFIFMFIHIFIVSIFVSCDQPTERRRIVSIGDYSKDSNGTGTGTGMSGTSGTSNNSNNSNNSNTSTINSGGTSGTPSTTTNISTNSGSLNLPAEFAHCNMNPPKYNNNASLVGEYNVCLSNESNSTKILFQVKSSIIDYPLCMFPINGNSMSSVMIGDAKCIPAPIEADKIYTVQLAINRPNFTNSVMSGIIFIKNAPYDGEVTAYNYNGTTTTYPEAYRDCMLFYTATGNNLACVRFKNKGKYFTYFFGY